MGFLEHLSLKDLVDGLEECALFNALPREILAELAPELRWVELKGREILFHQGDPADSLYIVFRGRLRAFRAGGDGLETVLGDISRGGYVGEVALLIEQTRTATVRAVRDSLLIKLSQQGFYQLLLNFPQVSLPLAREIFRRSQTPNPRADNTPEQFQTLAVVPASPALPLEAFMAQLQESLKKLGKTIRLSREMAAAYLGAGFSGEPAFSGEIKTAGALAQLEDDHKFVIYQAEPNLSGWTRLCLRQADLVLVVGELSDPGGLEILKQAFMGEGLNSLGAYQDLVLLRQPGQPVKESAPWLSHFNFRAHYHLELHNRPDMERLVRLLTGRATGMALSGGGGRSTSFVGVLKAFEERGIPVDLIAGTSGGAIVAGLYGLGLGWKEIAERVRYLSRQHVSRRDFSPPFISVLSGKRFDRALQATFGEQHLEDLPRIFLACCTSLTSGEVVVPQLGPVWKAVRASSSIPGVWPPVVLNNHVLVDGGVLNNLPADLLSERCRKGKIVACDVTHYNDFGLVLPEVLALSGWRRLGLKLNPFAKAVSGPNLFDIVSSAGTLASLRHTSQVIQEEVDLYISPQVSQFSTLDVGSDEICGQLIEIGYEQASRQLDEGAAGQFQL